MPNYPTVNLEPPAKAAVASPIARYVTHRDCYASDAPCSICGAPCSSFADAIHEDGSVSGWVRVCPKCAAGHKAAKTAPAPAPEATEAEPVKQASPTK